MATPVVMPQLGESVVEGVVVQWRVKEGDLVKADDPIAEVETDKATTELPSPVAGRVLKFLVKTGETVAVGKAILEIETEVTAVPAATVPGRAAPEKSAAEKSAAERAAAETDSESPVGGSAPVQVPESAPLVLKAPTRAPAPRAAGAPTPPTALSSDARISPVVRKMAEEFHLDLAQIAGTGDGGRITKKDVQAFLARPPAPAAANPSAGVAPASSTLGGAEAPVPFKPAPVPVPVSIVAGDQVLPFSRRRKIIAERMSQSRLTIPEVTTFAEVDMAKVGALRARYKAQSAKVPGAPKLTYLPFVCYAAVRALREYPQVNAQVQADSYVLKSEIHLGVAVDSPEGLTVPVIRRAEELTLVGLARANDELGEKARAGKLSADDLAGGTFTVSNPGLKGNLFGTPIINLPQAGILRMGEVVKRAVVIERDGEDTIVIRPMMYLAFAYDHRIIDGVAGNAYLHRVKELLEAGDFPL